MRKIECYFIVCAFFFFVTGCASGPVNVGVKPDFWNARGNKIGVVLVNCPAGSATKVGAQGLLDVAINNAVSGSVQQFLEDFKPDDFSNVGDLFVKELKNRGMNAKKIEKCIDLKSFETKVKNKNDRVITITDLKPFFKSDDIDTLVLIQLNSFGTIRNYYGFIPLNAPSAIATVTGQMIDLTKGEYVDCDGCEKMWYLRDTVTVPVSGEWDQSPDYPNLFKAVQEAIVASKKRLLVDLFGDNIMVDTSTVPSPAPDTSIAPHVIVKPLDDDGVKGIAFLVAGNYNQAVEYLQKAYVQKPDDTATGLNLNLAYARSGQPDRAVTFCNDLINKHGSTQFAHYVLGMAYLVKEDYGNAQRHLDSSLSYTGQAVIPNPYVNDAYYYRGVARVINGEIEDGRDDIFAAGNMYFKDHNEKMLAKCVAKIKEIEPDSKLIGKLEALGRSYDTVSFTLLPIILVFYIIEQLEFTFVFARCS